MNEYELYHHGILGMKWGVRRYQNEDGSLTDAGMKRYRKDVSKIKKNLNKTSKYIEKKNQANDKKIRAYQKLGWNEFRVHNREKWTVKENRYKGKANDSLKRASKLSMKLVNKYGNKTVSELNPEFSKEGEKWVMNDYGLRIRYTDQYISEHRIMG